MSIEILRGLTLLPGFCHPLNFSYKSYTYNTIFFKENQKIFCKLNYRYDTVKISQYNFFATKFKHLTTDRLTLKNETNDTKTGPGNPPGEILR